MGCLETYNSPVPMIPRLSFSNDFVESSSTVDNNEDQIKINKTSSDDFEFSAVTSTTNHQHQNQTMTAADELFFEGKLLPTLRDELLILDDEDELLVPPKGLPKWKDFLSLKRSVDGRTANNSRGKIPKPPHIPT